MRKIVRVLIVFTLLLIVRGNLIAQDTLDYYNPSFLRYDNHIYKPEIKTVILERKDRTLSEPVIGLGMDEVLLLKFDELGEETKDYSYRFIHCDAVWQPSQLSESDFIDGFFNDHIINYRHSLSTNFPYIHYELEFPNQQMRPLYSGNYLLVVYENDQPDLAVISRRFWVTENRVDIKPTIHRATAIESRDAYQEVDFMINTNTLKVQNPYTDFKVTITQNNRNDIAIYNLKPLFVKDNELDYNFEDGNLFQAGNEFRNFDIRSVRFQTQYTEKIELDSAQHYHVYLKGDPRKATQRYSITDDINGKYLIKVYEGREGDLEGEYVYVHFRMPVMEPFENANLFIFGQLTDWTLPTWSRFFYDAEKGEYNLTLLLKQGYYNYEYLLMSTGKNQGETFETEGNHFETENDYQFYVYYREPAGRYDRLVGFKRGNSKGN
ncbi:DUF5103 domain-containing protein [soil metagenome]